MRRNRLGKVRPRRERSAFLGSIRPDHAPQPDLPVGVAFARLCLENYVTAVDLAKLFQQCSGRIS
jgi:hypothetical protein